MQLKISVDTPWWYSYQLTDLPASGSVQIPFRQKFQFRALKSILSYSKLILNMEREYWKGYLMGFILEIIILSGYFQQSIFIRSSCSKSIYGLLYLCSHWRTLMNLATEQMQNMAIKLNKSYRLLLLRKHLCFISVIDFFTHSNVIIFSVYFPLTYPS